MFSTNAKPTKYSELLDDVIEQTMHRKIGDGGEGPPEEIVVYVIDPSGDEPVGCEDDDWDDPPKAKTWPWFLLGAALGITL